MKTFKQGQELFLIIFIQNNQVFVFRGIKKNFIKLSKTLLLNFKVTF